MHKIGWSRSNGDIKEEQNNIIKIRLDYISKHDTDTHYWNLKRIDID